jgi:phosphopantetheine--protein transferase-like protein
MALSLFGIGVDIAHIPRFGRIVQRWGNRFLRRAYAPSEILRYESLIANDSRGESYGVDAPKESVCASTAFLASRWAAKEALHKAIAPRSGLRLDFREVEVISATFPRREAVNYTSNYPGLQGGPSFAFLGAATTAMARFRLSPPELSLSHDGEYAVAFVVVAGPTVASHCSSALI